MRLGVEDVVSKDVDDIPQRTLHTHLGFLRYGNINRQNSTYYRDVITRLGNVQLLQTTVEIGIRLNDVQMGVLRLRIIGIQLREAHVGYGPPLARASLYIPVIDRV